LIGIFLDWGDEISDCLNLAHYFTTSFALHDQLSSSCLEYEQEPHCDFIRLNVISVIIKHRSHFD
jgi:hypothetical protein